jgi:hypothetical protein
VFVFLIRDPKAGDTSAMACFVYVAEEGVCGELRCVVVAFVHGSYG